MYRRCIFCHKGLGTNEALEAFPVGRRLAFDGDRGRLWVICEHCHSWNLSPLDQRWEAIEECERRFQDTARRYSTDNIGLAQLEEGLQLVRVGRPGRREFAAWRYGREFLKRRARGMARAVGFAGAGVASLVGPSALPLILATHFYERGVVTRVHTAAGKSLPVVREDVRETYLLPTPGPARWVLHVTCRRAEQRSLGFRLGVGLPNLIELEGSEGLAVAGRLLARINWLGGSGMKVRDAVKLIEDAGSPAELISTAALSGGRAGQLKRMDADLRLALEMSAHEEAEQRALEGELVLLERAWRDAEEIAAIADRLLIPPQVEEWIERHRM